MSDEEIYFSDMYVAVIEITEELYLLLHRRVPLHLHTDSKRTFYVISKGSRTYENGLC